MILGQLFLDELLALRQRWRRQSERKIKPAPDGWIEKLLMIGGRQKNDVRWEIIEIL